jgi:hypothetical protein
MHTTGLTIRERQEHGQMKSKHTPPGRTTVLSGRIGSALAFLCLLALFAAAPASAGFEQVDTFAEGSEGLPNYSIMAVNATGAGGVPAGTIYGSANEAPKSGTYRYSAKGELLGLWRKDQPKGIAIDQTTGYVYTLSAPIQGSGVPEHEVIHVYSADGTELIAAFGDGAKDQVSETIEESPEKIHGAFWRNGIAVDDEGTVYISDATYKDERRVMIFKPQSPGDYEHYAYSGRANDIDGTTGSLAIDDANNLYIKASAEIEEFAPGEPPTPICEYKLPGHEFEAFTVNPANGEVFYYDGKTPTVVHQLSACDGEGKFDDKGSFKQVPNPSDGISTMAFNPAMAWGPSRPNGILYSVDGTRVENSQRVYAFAPAAVHFPVVESEDVSSVTATTATLKAKINPKGSATHYAFQYETKAAYEANPPGERFAGASEAPLGGDDLPASQETLTAASSLVGLTPDTEYRYRVIATSHCEPENEENPCEDTGEDKAFRTFPTEAPGLADNRAWELVSPAQKSGGEVWPVSHNFGDGTPGSGGGTFPMQSSPDGDAVAYMGYPFSNSEGAAIQNEYLSKRSASGWQTTALSPALQGSNPSGHVAFNPELTQGIISQGTPSLTPDAPFEYANLYTQPTASPSSLTPLLGFEPPNRSPGTLQLNYAGASDDLSHVFFAANDALTGETPFAPEAVDGGAEVNTQANLYESVGGQLRLVNVLPGNAETVPGADFGAGPIQISDLPHAISADGSHVYWSDKAGQLYVRINGESTVEIPDPGRYLTASEDGSKVLLRNGHLYDLQTEALTDLTEGQGGFGGIAGQSKDLSHIYFSDTAVLSGEEENEYGAKAEAGEENLYEWNEGQSTFIGRRVVGSEDTSPTTREAEASPDGRWLAFTSNAPLTGYDSAGGSEVFLYDSATAKLICASCDPSAPHPSGGAFLTVFFSQNYLPQPHYLTDSGRVYFNTTDSLTPFDTNGRGGEDVYQYEPEGIGSCKRQAGCVSLISAGHEPMRSNLLSVDESGKNVFFVTRDQLSLKDTDDLLDLYVAREGGGQPSETETSRGECQGEACVPAISAPNDPTPGSSSFEGAGNVDEQKQTKKHRHKKRKHAKKAHRNRAHKRANHNRGGAK